MAKKKVEVENLSIRAQEFIQESTIEDVMSEGFGRYSKYVLQERAVPDVRDGLKPVQRKVIFDMYELGAISYKDRIKSARTVGDTMGKYHAHGATFQLIVA